MRTGQRTESKGGRERGAEDCVKAPLLTLIFPWTSPSWRPFPFVKFPLLSLFLASLHPPYPPSICLEFSPGLLALSKWSPKEVPSWIKEKHQAVLSQLPWFLWVFLLLIFLCSVSVRQLCFQLEKSLWPKGQGKKLPLRKGAENLKSQDFFK